MSARAPDLPPQSRQVPEPVRQAGSGAGSEQPPSAQAPNPPKTIRFDGWARASVEVTPLSDTDREPQADQANVPHDVIVTRGILNLRARYLRGRSFEAVGTALVTSGLFIPGSNRGKQNDSSRGEIHAEAREAYVGFFAKTVDVRVGTQRIAWGHADAFSPNDVVNANDLRDPILSEIELLHRPTFAIRVDVERSFGSLQIVARPLFQPDRYAVYGQNWAFVQADAPAGYRGVLGVLSRQPNVSREEVGEALLVDGPRPAGLAGSQGGLRFDWKVGTIDVTHYYDYGYHGTPDFRIDQAAIAQLDLVDWNNVSPDQAGMLLSAIDANHGVDSRWQRKHHVGLDLGTTKGPFALRVDAAYQQPGLFYDRTLNGWLSPTVQAVFGAEYQTGQIGRTILVEGRYRHIHREPPVGGLLFASRNIVDTAVLIRWTWMDRIEFEARGVAGGKPASYVFRPQIAWKRDSLSLRLGVVLLGGEEGSFGDWYKTNRSVYLMLRRAF